MAIAKVGLDDKYDLDRGRIYVTGSQAVARLAMMQHALDAANGLNTAGYITGYRGSPIGGLDLTMARAQAFLREHSIVFQSGLNEDLAATAVGNDHDRADDVAAGVAEVHAVPVDRTSQAGADPLPDRVHARSPQSVVPCPSDLRGRLKAHHAERVGVVQHPAHPVNGNPGKLF